MSCGGVTPWIGCLSVSVCLAGCLSGWLSVRLQHHRQDCTGGDGQRRGQEVNVLWRRHSMDWLAGCLSVSVWLAGCLASCLAGCLSGWLSVSVSGWLAGWLTVSVCLAVCLPVRPPAIPSIFRILCPLSSGRVPPIFRTMYPLSSGRCVLYF